MARHLTINWTLGHRRGGSGWGPGAFVKVRVLRLSSLSPASRLGQSGGLTCCQPASSTSQDSGRMYVPRPRTVKQLDSLPCRAPSYPVVLRQRGSARYRPVGLQLAGDGDGASTAGRSCLATVR